MRTIIFLAVTLGLAGCEDESRSKRRAPPAPDHVDVDVDLRDAGPKLAVTGLEPSAGPSAGQTRVVIHGRGFTTGGVRRAKVYFGQKLQTVVGFESDYALIIETQGGVAGETVDVLVIFEPGGEITLPGAFTYADDGKPRVQP